VSNYTNRIGALNSAIDGLLRELFRSQPIHTRPEPLRPSHPALSTIVFPGISQFLILSFHDPT
jgi:hypothetical protein